MGGETVLVSAGWDTSGALESAYRVVGDVLYDSKATPPATITVSTGHRAYLPAILRRAP